MVAGRMDCVKEMANTDTTMETIIEDHGYETRSRAKAHFAWRLAMCILVNGEMVKNMVQVDTLLPTAISMKVSLLRAIVLDEESTLGQMAVITMVSGREIK